MSLLRTIADSTVLAALTGRLERLTPERPRRWGTMTAHQMAAHLAHSAEAALTRHPFSAPERRPSRVIKVAALYLPLPWPPGIKTGANPAGAVVTPETFDADRLAAIATLRDVAAAPAEGLARRHPLFGPMTRAQWHRWAFLHADHHLRQFGL